jgi:hypothetical protein
MRVGVRRVNGATDRRRAPAGRRRGREARPPRRVRWLGRRSGPGGRCRLPPRRARLRRADLPADTHRVRQACARSAADHLGRGQPLPGRSRGGWCTPCLDDLRTCPDTAAHGQTRQHTRACRAPSDDRGRARTAPSLSRLGVPPDPGPRTRGPAPPRASPPSARTTSATFASACSISVGCRGRGSARWSAMATW